MPTFDTVPLPRDKIREKEPVNMEILGLDAWPNNRFRLRLDWNDTMGQWLIRLRHLGTDTLITHSVASLLREYKFEPYVQFIFYDKSGRATEITPANLGRNVKLGVLPIEE